MGRALMVTVGTGARSGVSIVRPLVKTVRGSNPDYVVFLVTVESEANALKVATEVGLRDGQWRAVRLDASDDLDIVFTQVAEEVRRLEREGYPASSIELDFTSGKKSMSAGAVLAAASLGFGGLKYVTGERDVGLVMDGTERVLTLEPTRYFAERDIASARTLFERLRFDAALDVCSAVDRRLLTEQAASELGDLKSLIVGFDSWDKFDHFRAAGELGKVDFSRPRNTPYFLKKKMVIARLQDMGRAVKSGEIAEDLVADLANNAERRWLEGKYDDAVARLYRLVEMIAQRELRRQFEIDTGNVDMGKTPESWRQRLEKHRDPVDNKVKIGLVQGYALLAALGVEVGLAFQSNRKLSALLRERNESILAHGTRSISKEACTSLLNEVVALAGLAVPDFGARRSELQFPWLRSEPAGSRPLVSLVGDQVQGPAAADQRRPADN